MICDVPVAIAPVNPQADLNCLEELRVFNGANWRQNYPIPLAMPFIAHETMPQLERLTFNNPNSRILEWIVSVADTPFRNQVTLCSDGADQYVAS